MGMLSEDKVRLWGMLAGRAIRKVVLAGLTAVGIALVAAVVLWDADFHAARQRWEAFREAMFGPWHGGTTLGGIRKGEQTTCYMSTDKTVVLCIQRPSSGMPQKRPNARPEGNGKPPVSRNRSGRSRKWDIGLSDAASSEARPRPALRIPSLFDQQQGDV